MRIKEIQSWKNEAGDASLITSEREWGNVDLPYIRKVENGLEIELTQNRVKISHIDPLRHDTAQVKDADLNSSKEIIDTFARRVKDFFELERSETIRLRQGATLTISTQTLDKNIVITVNN